MATALNVILHANQKIIHDSKARYKVIKAGKRFGKTKWALFEICQAAGRCPNGVFWFVCPTYRQAKNIAWWELSWLLPRDKVKRSVETELYKELTNGARIQLIGADNEEALRGPKLQGVVFDEVAYTKEYAWSGIISGQLLGSNGKPGGFAYFISSPNKDGRNWFTNFHADAKRKEMAGDKDWAAFYFTIYDNPTLNREEIDKLKEGKSDEVWDLEYMGIESSYAGVLYHEYTTEKNSGNPPEKPLPIVRSIDWGINHPTVCLWAKIDQATKQVYLYDEYVKTGMVIQESCSTIKEKTGEKPVEWTVIDPSTSKRNSQTGRTDSVEFARNGITCIPGDNRNRGYDITKMFLKKGLLKISPLCKNLLNEIRNVQWGDKEGDDCTDALRYMMVRIHDCMNGMNIMDVSENTYTPNADRPLECNMFDKNFKDMFPSESKRNFIMEDLEMVG